MNANLFHDTSKPSTFSTLTNLQAAIKQTEESVFLLRKHVLGWNAKTRTRYINLLENIFPEINMLSLMKLRCGNRTC
jgi:hypothetical protein